MVVKLRVAKRNVDRSPTKVMTIKPNEGQKAKDGRSEKHLKSLGVKEISLEWKHEWSKETKIFIKNLKTNSKLKGLLREMRG